MTWIICKTLRRYMCLVFIKEISLTLLSGDTKKRKEKSWNAACAFSTQHKDKFTSPKHKLLAFLVKANTAWG